MNFKRHHVLYVVLAVSLIVALLVFMTFGLHRASFTAQPAPAAALVSMATSSSKQMQFEIVTSRADQERGLSGRADIPHDYGMLFVFENKSRVGFWMKDMLVPIDIIWLSDEGRVLGIEDSIAPESYPASVYPPEPVKYVLETRAGEMSRLGYVVGSLISLPLPYGR